MRVFRIVLISVGVACLVLGIIRLNLREVDRTGLCGSIVQGSSHDDGGADTGECDRLRHHDRIWAAAFLVVAVVALGVGVAHVLLSTDGDDGAVGFDEDPQSGGDELGNQGP